MENGQTDQSGLIIVEAALVIPILVLFIFITAGFGLLFREYLTMVEAARLGARTAAFETPGTSSSSLSSNALDAAEGHLEANGLRAADFQISISPSPITAGTAILSAARLTVVQADAPGFSRRLLTVPVKLRATSLFLLAPGNSAVQMSRGASG